MEIIRLNEKDINALHSVTSLFGKTNGILSCNSSFDVNFLGILFGQGWMRVELTQEFFEKIWRKIFTPESNLPQPVEILHTGAKYIWCMIYKVKIKSGISYFAEIKLSNDKLETYIGSTAGKNIPAALSQFHEFLIGNLSFFPTSGDSLGSIDVG